MAGLAFLSDTIAFLIVIFWAFRAEVGRGARGLLAMIGDAIASAGPSGPPWAAKPRLEHAQRHVPGWRRSLGGVRIRR